MPAWLEELLAIALLLAGIAVVLRRVPRVELGHSTAFLKRRRWNWIPLGLTYAVLYFARYNLNSLKDVKVISEAEYGQVFAIGAWVYGLSFLVNGPLTDRLGGRRTMLIATAGSALANVALGLVARQRGLESPVTWMAPLYAVNMYFQSFGAVSIVKVNSSWFHLRERGMIGGAFGILISLGIYFAFDGGLKIARALPPEWVFLIPAAALLVFFAVTLRWVRDLPSQAGLHDFDPQDASSLEDGPRLALGQVLRNMLTHPAIVTIMCIEWCSGFLRNAIMHWYRDFARGMGLRDSFVYAHWGILLCLAGILGGVFAGVVSDRVFQSRRGPMAAVLYGLMLLAGLCMLPALTTPASIGWIVIFMSMCVIGVHGMLSGTASMDFGGRKNTGVAVGIIDGMVYFGTGVQSLLLGYLLPAKGTTAASEPGSWRSWPLAMLPVIALGLALSARLWNARVRSAREQTPEIRGASGPRRPS